MRNHNNKPPYTKRLSVLLADPSIKAAGSSASGRRSIFVIAGSLHDKARCSAVVCYLQTSSNQKMFAGSGQLPSQLAGSVGEYTPDGPSAVYSGNSQILPSHG